MDIPESDELSNSSQQGQPTDKKSAPADESVRPGPGKAGRGSGAFAEPDASGDLADLLDRTDRLLGTGAARGSRAPAGAPERAPAHSAEVRDGDRLSTGTTGTM
ncbi:hypothetical protein JXD38_02140, partial [candidate division WOR-3 bacterium]|nr:hypothetical protein [candidate division WOR-3 bacterium]